jgi:hypothetical protein
MEPTLRKHPVRRHAQQHDGEGEYEQHEPFVLTTLADDLTHLYKLQKRKSSPIEKSRPKRQASTQSLTDAEVAMAVLTIVWNFLNGKKSYLASAGLMALATYKVSAGDFGHASELVLAAMAVSGLRHALAKVGI